MQNSGNYIAMADYKKIILSRSDGIGDVVLSLPLAGILKAQFPQIKILFLGRAYTEDIIKSCKHVDGFINWDIVQQKTKAAQIQYFKNLQADAVIHVFPQKKIARLSKKANIPLRIGTGGRIYHWLYCNKKVFFSRRRSDLHEAQLNTKLLQGLGIHKQYAKEELPDFYGLSKIRSLDFSLQNLLDKKKFNLIIHPKSKGSAREWGLENFAKLVNMLPKNKYKIFATGTKQEGESMREELFAKCEGIVDLSGKLSLSELISFIANADGLIAASTGPLHIAAAVGKAAIGIYPPIKPMHPGRWAPLGKKACFLAENKQCKKCKKQLHCECIENISPATVADKIEKLSS